MVSSVDLNNYSHIIYQFSKRDGGRLPGDMKCKSMLLQLKRDMDFMLCHFDKATQYSLSNSGANALYRNRPLLAPVLLYCTSIDMLAVILFNRPRNSSQIGIHFKKVAKLIFSHNESDADTLWKLRNSLAHEYNHVNTVISPVGPVNKILDENGDFIAIYTENMRRNLNMSIKKVNEYTNSLSGSEQNEVCERIIDKGLYKVRGQFKKPLIS